MAVARRSSRESSMNVAMLWFDVFLAFGITFDWHRYLARKYPGCASIHSTAMCCACFIHNIGKARFSSDSMKNFFGGRQSLGLPNRQKVSITALIITPPPLSFPLSFFLRIMRRRAKAPCVLFEAIDMRDLAPVNNRPAITTISRMAVPLRHQGTDHQRRGDPLPGALDRNRAETL